MSLAALETEILAVARRRRLYSGLAVILTASVLIAGFDLSNSMNSGSFGQGLSKFFDYPAQLVSEAWAAGPEFPGLLVKYFPALLETLNIALVATLLGGAGAALLALIATRDLGVPGWVILPTRRFMDVTRAFPELIIALFLIFVLGSSPVPAMIAVAIHTAGALGKLFSEVAENIDRKPLDGLAAAGGSWFQRIRFGVLPQVAPNWLSYFLLRLEINVRASAILGFVGAGGIGSELSRTIGWGQGAGDDTVALFVLLIASIVLIDQFSSWARGRLAGLTGQGGEEQDDGLSDDARRDAARSALRRRALRSVGAPLAILAYLAYAWAALGVGGIIASARPERAVLLGLDSVMHKVHVVEDLRRGEIEIAVEGERTATWAPGTAPDWVRLGADGAPTEIDLGGGHRVAISQDGFRYDIPGVGLLSARAVDGEIVADLPPGMTPETAPDWLRLDPRKVDARPTLSTRVQMSRSKIEVHRYFWGWENFWFPFRSPFHALSMGELWSLAWSSERIDPARSNARHMLDDFLTNPDWLHGQVLVALLETLMMAVLGTLVACLVGLPLAFLAARNFTPAMAVRFGVRRLFDFLRGVDALIWSLIFIRAFGLGPLTGALAIAFTDTGSLGKLFSEALENVDGRQIEGVHATGASQVQRYRFGVIPQILPVFLSQGLYFLESNTRSATIIGALGAGGIGLLLVETIRTARDWENTLYIIILTILLVMAMDSASSWIRRRVIEGRSPAGPAPGAEAAPALAAAAASAR